MHSVTLPDAVRMWPTPQARDWIGPQGQAYKGIAIDLLGAVLGMVRTPTTAGSGRSKEFAGNSWPTPEEVAKKEGGQLNPDWVEWLMGFPVGWTSLTSQE